MEANSKHPPRVILFPGLGADSRMFNPQRPALPEIETPSWIPHEPSDSLQSYAQRLARTLNITQPAILGGVSMGGMIALEVSKVVPTRCVVLIASCRDIAAASGLLKFAEQASRLVPSIAIDKARRLAPLVLGRGGTLSPDDRRLLATMASELPIEFIRWAGRAVLEWPGCPDPGVPVHHIHGERDWVIPLKRVRADRVVKCGMHVLNLSHPAEVNAYLRMAIERHGG